MNTIDVSNELCLDPFCLIVDLFDWYAIRLSFQHVDYSNTLVAQ